MEPQSVAPPLSRPYLRTLTITVCLITMIQNGLSWPTIVFYGKQFGASASFFGWVVTSFLAVQLISIPLWGHISDRIGRRPVLLICIFGSALSMLVMGFATSLTWIFVSRLMSAFFSASVALIGASIADVCKPEDRTKSMAAVEASTAVGFYIVGPLLGGLLADINLSIPYFVASGLGVVNLIYAFFYIHETHSQQLKPVTAAPAVQSSLVNQWRLIFSKRNAAGGIIAIFLLGLAQGPMEVCYPLILKDHLAFDARSVAFLLVFLGSLLIPLQLLLVPRVARQWGEARLVSGGVALLAVAMLMLAGINLMLPAQTWIVLIEKTIFAFGAAATFSPLASIVASGAPTNMKGSTMGLYRAANSLGRMAAPIGALLYDGYGSSIAFFAISMAFAVGAVFCSIWKWKSSAVSFDQNVAKAA